jgi:NADH-ubiquinone oxidoreductase chain 5
MYLRIVRLPLLASIFSRFGRNYFGVKGAQILTVISVIISFFISTIRFYNVGINGDIIIIPLLQWFNSGYFICNWSIYLDSITVIMLIVVTSISRCVHIYSTEYMSRDPHQPRFMSYLSLFTFFMLILITADNFIQLFVGWEGVGLCSYLLINFWFTRIEANKAAMKAIIVNRIGDFGLTLAMIRIFRYFNCIDFITLFATIDYFHITNIIDQNSLNFIRRFLFVGAVGKSAQIGLHTWLPDAMEGPTPVSALIHAATMVTAGVFLIIRCSPIFIYRENILIYITLIGSLTAFFAATSGMAQFDLKKVVAYSTCSQLGYMIFACGLSCFSISLFHLFNHAFFKALLFLSCGSVIHALHDEQDMRKMGGLVSILPLTSILFLIGSLALMGFPFLTGFYSKDVLIEVAYANYSISRRFAHWLASISAFITAFYSFRLYYLTFLRKTNRRKASLEQRHDAPLKMMIPLILLAFPSIFIGYIMRDLFIGLGTDYFQNAIPLERNQRRIYIESEFLPIYIKLIPLIMTILGIFSGLLIYHIINNLNINHNLFTFFNQKWHFDNIYNYYIRKNILYIGYHHTYLTIDRGFFRIIWTNWKNTFYNFNY